MEWEEEDGSTFNIDCDLNVPTVPCGTPYDGGIKEISNYLRKERPVNWIEEDNKLQGMGEAAINPFNLEPDDWQIKFRMISPDTVLPRQVRVGSFS